LTSSTELRREPRRSTSAPRIRRSASHIGGNGSRDIGLMQINSAWLPTLAAHGINERDLFEPCTNIHVGAWILAGNVSRLGYTWDAVGAYNATRPALRRAYVDKVRRHLPAAIPASAPPARRMTFASLR
jgi:soluble lytic murein transglycosylase-like protein